MIVRRNYILLILPLIIFIFTLSCKNSKTNHSAEINARFLFSKGEVIYLDEVKVFETTIIDSIIINENGEFSFKIKTDGPQFYRLRINNNNLITLLIDSKEKITINADIRSLASTYKVEGSEGSKLVYELHTFTFENYKRLDSLAQIWEYRKYDNDNLILRDSLDSIALQIYNSQEEFVKNFIKENQSNLASIMALYQVFGRQSLLDEIEDLDIFEETAIKLKSAYPNNSHVNELNARVYKNKQIKIERDKITERLSPGNFVPEISLPNQNGEPVSILDFKGNNILIFFWSSSSTKSRSLINELTQLHKQYSTKGFLLFNVSFDMNQDLWKKTINFEKMPGIHVNDSREWSSPVIKMFNIKAFPHHVLIDREGKIIGTNLSIDEIKDKLNLNS